jgi:hypothetical protein
MKCYEKLEMQHASEITDYENKELRAIKLCTCVVTGAQPAENIWRERGFLRGVSGFGGNG